MKAERSCGHPGCERPYHSKGMCSLHYARRKLGIDMDLRTPTLEERFMAKTRQSPSGCLEWVGVTHRGYGHFGMRSPVTGKPTMAKAHRVAYEMRFGKIPEGLVIDHLCRNRSCVNPDHLEPVTARENTLRGINFSAVNAKKTHCPQGHPLSGENLYVIPSTGGRTCRTCKRAESKARAERKRKASK